MTRRRKINLVGRIFISALTSPREEIGADAKIRPTVLRLLLCYLLLNSAFGDTITFSFHDGLGNPITNTECIFTQKGISANGPLPGLTTSATFSIFTDSNGSNSSPNFQGGIWNGHLKSNPDTYFQIIVPGDGGTHFFGSLLTNLSTLPQGIFLNASNTSGPSNFLTLTTNGTTISVTFTASTNAITNNYSAPVTLDSSLDVQGFVEGNTLTNGNGAGIDEAGNIWGQKFMANGTAVLAGGGTLAGAFIANGASIVGLTGLTAQSIGATNFIGITATSNSVNVCSFGAVCDGSTDNTTAFANALLTHIPVFVPQQDFAGNSAGFVVGNLTLSNNVLFGYGGHLIFKPSVTNYMIQFAPIAVYPSFTGSQVNFNFNKLLGLELDGGAALGTNYPITIGTRHGVYVDAFGTNSTMMDCQIHGFNGVGVYISSTKPTSAFGTSNAPPAGPDMGNAVIEGLRVSQCYQGIETAYTNNGNPYDAEYLILHNCMCYSNYFGCYIASGNIGAVGCSFSRNYVGVCVYPAQNDGHGFVSDCFVNHNNFNVELTNITAGFQFHGDHFIGYVPNGSTNYVVGCARVDFIGNQSANTTWVLDASTNAGVNRIEFPYDYPLYSGDTYSHLNGDVSIVEFQDTGSVVGLMDPRRLLNSSVNGLTVTNATNWGGGPGTAAALTTRVGPIIVSDLQPIIFRDSGGTYDGGIRGGNNGTGLLNLVDASTNAFMNIGNGTVGGIGIQFYNSSQNILNNGAGTCNIGSSSSPFNTVYANTHQGGVFNGNASGLSNTFNDVATPSIAGTASGVTNTSTNAGTAVITNSTAVTITNFNSAGAATDTNTTTFYPCILGPGEALKTSGAAKARINF